MADYPTAYRIAEVNMYMGQEDMGLRQAFGPFTPAEEFFAHMEQMLLIYANCELPPLDKYLVVGMHNMAEDLGIEVQCAFCIRSMTPGRVCMNEQQQEECPTWAEVKQGLEEHNDG